MADTATAAADLLRMIPVKIRQGIYGAMALLILVDAWWNILPETVGGNLAATFAGLSMVMALVNTKPAPTLPPPVAPQFPDEFA